ncbi:MAG TPA: hypothetical protein VJZ16_04755 [Syntrophales bacterium]|nr:hypothetical protein [Syntrophales bacterium]
MMTHLSLKRIQSSIFLISSALIAYQILLVKLLSIQYWYHFSYLIISIALLGVGTSGTFIFIFKGWLKNHLSAVLFVLPLLLTSAIWANIYLLRTIEFNPLMIIWLTSEILNLLYLCLSIFIPFFFGALYIGLIFSVFADHAYRIYFVNLTGSGLGSLIALLTVFIVGPHENILIISMITISASFIMSNSRIRKLASGIIMASAVLLYFLFLHHRPLEMTKFKDLSQAANLTEAKKEWEIFGPLGLVTVLDSPAFHYLPDLSLNCPCPLPRQKGLFLDGNTVGAINQFNGNLEDLCFLDYRTSSLAYKILHHPEVLIIGGGSGTEILNARRHQARTVSVVEMNGDIVALMRGPYRSFGGDIYHPGYSRVFVEEGRGYLERTKQSFDLIQISLLESMGSASAGVYSLNENYLFTTEALETSLSHLKPEGILSISRWIKNPPRDNIKLLAMAIEAIEAHGKNAPSLSMIMVRSWQTATILVKNGTFHHEEIEAVKSFCKSRFFDLCYYPGIRKEETNIFNKLEKSYFYLAALRLLSPAAREQFYKEYPFYIRPATDDRPFFSHFFKIEMLKRYLGTFGRHWIPFMDWGYILVFITAAILFLLGMIFILAPIRLIRPPTGGLVPVFIYFGALGMAYMFLEMSILQQFIRYLYDPVFSASVVIGSFLVYSGIGSLLAGRIGGVTSKHIWGCIFCIGVMVIVFSTFDWWLPDVLAGLSLWIRMFICSLLILPLAIPMGIPFPSGLIELRGRGEEIIPWAWGINGFFSVMGSSAAVLIAIGWGFKSVLLTALTFYLLSAVMFIRLKR